MSSAWRGCDSFWYYFLPVFCFVAPLSGLFFARLALFVLLCVSVWGCLVFTSGSGGGSKRAQLTGTINQLL